MVCRIMNRKPQSEEAPSLPERLDAAGIDREQLANAAKAAANLCAQSRPLEGTCLDPTGHADFNVMFAHLARGDAS